MWIIFFSILVVLIILGVIIGTIIGLKQKGNTPRTVLRMTTTTTTISENIAGIFLWNKM